MKQATGLALLVTCWCWLVSATTTEPLTPAAYQGLIGPGFSTNWFKSIVPLSKYNPSNIRDVFNAGFKNLRLRSRAGLHPHDGANFPSFLANLEEVVDDCLLEGVIPIISWINHEAEEIANETHRTDYLAWWGAVATHLKDKDYKLGFNLFTELGFVGCGEDGKERCPESIRLNNDKYNNWTTEVVKIIRATGGNNANRILILGAPGKKADSLVMINTTIYENDSYMMVEWHLYAAGPTNTEGQKHWAGNGSESDRQNVLSAINKATTFTASSGLLTYLGAWMPQDNGKGGLDQTEVINFANYFVTEMGHAGIPWSLNVLDVYYDTKAAAWDTSIQTIKGQALNMSTVLTAIQSVM